ncbi:MAG: cytochrome c [Bacteroidales bacterium]|nr:cytochrome c [Bacteroidales bacterium]MCF6341259.1 cytochrome c [Bacteroidales bacterium]
MIKKTRLIKLIAAVITLSAISFQAMSQEKKNSEWKAPLEADQISNPFQGDDAAVKAGKKLYKQQCAVCHGDTGKGDGVAGLALTPKPASFKSERVQNESDGALYWKITNGRTPMASYKDLLTEEQRWQLVNYIRTFSK